MTYRAHLRILAPQPLGIEPGAVRIEAAAAERRMTREAVALGVAGGAALQTLPGGLPVPGNERSARIVIAGAQRAVAHQAGRGMARLTKTAGVVTIGAARFATVGGGRMALHESHGVITGRTRGGVRAVALQAIGAHVTSGAGARRRGRDGGVAPREILPMRRRRHTVRLSPDASIRSGRVQRHPDAL